MPVVGGVFPCVRCGLLRTMEKCWPCHWLDRAGRA